jgi:hypothetical protein
VQESLLAGGLAVVAAVALDALWTTLSAQGGGPLTRRLGAGLWTALTWRAGPHARRRQVAGAVVLLGTVGVWIGLLWAGWTLAFAAEPGSVVSSSTQTPADVWERIYYVGFTLVTLGTGDFVPSGDLWRVLTALCALSGLFLVTLAITYLLPVLQATVSKRQLAASISALGQTGGEIASLAAEAPAGMSRQAERMASDLSLHTERHLVYPVLHYFESGERSTALAPNLAALADGLLLLESLPSDRRPDAVALAELNSALGGYLDTVHGVFVGAAEDPPPAPRGPNGLATDRTTVERVCDERSRDRRRLLALVRQGGWGWPERADGR